MALFDFNKMNGVRITELSWLRSCTICSSMLPPIEFLCERCWDVAGDLARQNESFRPTGYPFPVAPVFVWDEVTDASLRRMVHAFKRGLFPRAADRFAGLHWSGQVKNSNFGPTRPGVENTVIVPAPGEGIDHAAIWALALSRNYGFPVLDVLIPEAKKTHQRLKSAAERSERRYRLRPGFEPQPDRHYIFVDDVITTGATAMAAYMALGDPAHFKVWTIVCRPRLASVDAL